MNKYSIFHIGLVPDAKYGVVSESLRHKVPQSKVCSMFCGGTDCKYCNPAGPKSPWKDSDMVIKGLFSNWYVVVQIIFVARVVFSSAYSFDYILR